MKKYIASLLSTIIFGLCFSSSALAAGFNIYMSGPDIFENSTTITVSVGGYNGISEEYGGVSAVVMTVN